MGCLICLNVLYVLLFWHLLPTCLKLLFYYINRYNFLDKSVGLSSLFEIRGSVVNSASSVVETQQPLCVPGLEGFLIPSKTRGHILKLIDGNTALVRWEVHNSDLLFSTVFLNFFCRISHGNWDLWSVLPGYWYLWIILVI